MTPADHRRHSLFMWLFGFVTGASVIQIWFAVVDFVEALVALRAFEP